MSNLLPGTLIERTFRERIILVGVIFPGMTEEMVGEELDELARLVDSVGADVVGRVVQRRYAADAATFVGRGKAEEIAVLSQQLTRTRSCSTTTCPRRNTATWRSCSGAPPSTGPR